MSRHSNFFFMIVLVTILFLGLNILARTLLYDNRLDLTQSRIFTLSDATKEIVENIEEPLTIRFFFAEKQANGLPVFQAYAERIRGLLKQYEHLSDDRITVEYLNPEPFTEAEDMAVSHGIQGVPVDAAGNKFYFGLSVENSTDDRGVMPFFDPARDEFLEYDLSRLVHDIAWPERKTIGLMSSLPLKGGASAFGLGSFSGPWVIYSQMEELFEIEPIQQNVTTIPEKVDVLMVVHPFDYPDAALYAIEQYILKGGKAIFFLDGYADFPSVEVKESKLGKLLDGWGVELVSGKVAAEKEAAINVQLEDGETRLQSFPNVTWLEMGESYFAKDSVITASLNNIRMIESGFFQLKENASVSMEPLISTTPAAMSVDSEKLREKTDALALFRNYVPDGKPLVLAAMLNGNVKSVFEPREDDKTYLEASKQPIHVMLVGDSDMLRDEFWAEAQNFFGRQLVVPTTDNGAFILNALEYLSGDNALINLRSRGTEERRFALIDDLRREAELKFREKENSLKQRLQDMETRLRELQSQEKDGSQLFSDSQTHEIASFRDEFLNTRKELRKVQHDLNKEIDALGTRLALLNILLIPLLILGLSFVLPSWLRRRRTSGRYRQSPSR